MKRYVLALVVLLTVVAGCSKEKVDWSPPIDKCRNETAIVKNLYISTQTGLEGTLELVRYGACDVYSFWSRFTQTGEWLPLEVISIRAGFEKPEYLITALQPGKYMVRTSSVSVGPDGFINSCVQKQGKPESRVCFEPAYQVPRG